MKKTISVIVLALVLCLSFAACGDKSAPQTDDPGADAAAGAASSEASTENADGKDNFTALDVDKDKRVSDIEITGMKMGKEEYTAGETVSVTVTWTGNPLDDTWIGIIPADTPHGSEELNDEFDIAYCYFKDMKSGDTFTFEDVMPEPGDYTLRVNDSDAGGEELAWCAFSVK